LASARGRPLAEEKRRGSHFSTFSSTPHRGGAGVHGFANRRGEFGVRFWKDKFGFEAAVLYFADAGLGGKPGSQDESGRSEAHSNALGHSGTAHDIADFSYAQQLSLFHDREGGTNLFEVGQDMGGDEDSFAFAIEAADQILEFKAGFGVQAGGRFVQDQKQRIVNDGAGNAKALLHSAGEAAHQGVVF